MSYLDTYLGSIRQFWEDPSVIELAINTDGTVWVERAGDIYMQPVTDHGLTPQMVQDLASQIGRNMNHTLRPENPLISTKVSISGSDLRTQIIGPPAVETCVAVSFRIHRPSISEEPKTFKKLRDTNISLEEERRAELQTLQDIDDLDDLLREIVTRKFNVIISGGTSTGKTELGRRLLWMVPDVERIITIEDSPELRPKQPNHLTLVAERNEQSPRSSDKLLEASLRLRPDRIILGELRGREAVTFLDAINTGHSGSFTTLHAETAQKALDRLALLVLATGSKLTMDQVHQYLRNSIDVIIQTGRNGSERGVLEIFFPALDRGNCENG